MKKENKKAQVTIFIIIGILILAAIIVFFAFGKEIGIDIGGKPESNINGLFESCLAEKLEGTIKILSEQGGYMENPLNISFQFKDEKEIKNISYLCYTIKVFSPCINQEPLLLNHVQKEIETEIAPHVKQCFDDVTKIVAKKEDSIEAKYTGFSVEVIPKKIVVNVDGEITSTQSGKTTKQEKVVGNFPSRLYEVVTVSEEVINQEATYCGFELVGFMLFYPEFEIDKALTRDSTSIYTVKHINGMEKFSFAIRSCSFPPGF